MSLKHEKLSAVVAIATRDGRLSPEVRDIGNWAKAAVQVVGCSDVARARARQLSRAVEVSMNAEAEWIVLLDDDMAVERENVERMIQLAGTDRVCFARYCDHTGKAMYTKLPGLGFLAGLGAWVTRAGNLRKLYEVSTIVHEPEGGPMREMTCSSARYVEAEKVHRWFSEDYELSRRLNIMGVSLVPGPIVGHYKRVRVYLNSGDSSGLVEEPDEEHPNG